MGPARNQILAISLPRVGIAAFLAALTRNAVEAIGP